MSDENQNQQPPQQPTFPEMPEPDLGLMGANAVMLGNRNLQTQADFFGTYINSLQNKTRKLEIEIAGLKKELASAKKAEQKNGAAKEPALKS